MIFFSQRVKIRNEYLKWCYDNGAKVCPENMVAFLQINNMIDEERARQKLKEWEKPMKKEQGHE